MKNRLLIWVTILTLAFTMSFSTVLSFADTPDTPSDDPVVMGDLGDAEDPVVTGEPESVDIDQSGVVANATDFGDYTAWDIECPETVYFNDNNPIEPVTVTMNGEPVPSIYYEVAYANNTAVTKSASYTVSSTSGGTVLKTGTFAIVYPMSTKYVKITLSKTNLPVKFKKNNDWKVITVAQKPTVKVTNPYANVTLKNGTDYTVKYNSPNSKNAGKYSIKVTMKGNYTGAKVVYYYIKPMKITGTDFFVYANARYYTGKKIKPKKVMIGCYDDRSKADMDLIKGTHYTVTKAATFSNNKKIGIADIKITIKGKGNFTGTAQLYGGFEIGPEKAKVKSVKAGKKKVTLKWTKSKHADGYRIEYFGWKNDKYTSTKVVYVKSNKTLKKTIKKLKSGYTYDFWVSSYKTIKGVKYFVYPSAKTVKVK